MSNELVPYHKKDLEKLGPAWLTDGVAERKHHEYSPSQLSALEACPCYRGKESVHERTLAGTRAHGVVESGEDDNLLDDSDAEAAVECLAFIDERRKLMEEVRQRANSPLRILELKEEYLPVDSEETTAGYCDHVLIDHTRENAELIDHKFGRHRVEEASSNPQGIAYSLGLFFRIPTLKSIKVWFVQPHAEFITEATFTREQVPVLMLRIRAIVERAKLARESGSFENAKPTTPNCLFCANAGRCPALLGMALQVAKKFHPLAIPADVTPCAILDPENIAKALELAGVLKVWADAFRSTVVNRVVCQQAPCPPGYELVSRSERSIADVDKFEAEALKHLTSEEFRATLTPGFGAVEKKIQEKAPRGMKKAAVDDFKQALVDSGAVVQGEPYVFLKVSTKKE